MTAWLLDTDILSELRRARPDPKVIKIISDQSLETLYVSAVTFAEIRFGIERVEDVQKREVMLDWLTHRLRPMFNERVLAVSEDLMFRWRLLVGDGRKEGHTFSQSDIFIAATALHHGLTMVTRNILDFERAKVQLLNPWKTVRKSKKN